MLSIASDSFDEPSARLAPRAFPGRLQVVREHLNVSGKEPFADEPAPLRPPRTRKQGAGGMQRVPIQGVRRRKPPLDRDELAARVALETDQKETGIELTGAWHRSLGVRIAAAQDALPRVVIRTGDADVGVRRDHGRAVASGVEVDWVVLLLLTQGSAAHLAPADRPFLLLQRARIPDVKKDANSPGDEIAASGHPLRPVPVRHPDEALHGLAILGADVGGPILEAHQVAGRGLGRARARGPAEALLTPSEGRNALGELGQDVDRVEGDLGVVRTGLDTEVAVRSCKVEILTLEGRQRLLCRRPLRRETESPASLAEEEGRPETEREREGAWREADCLARVDRRCQLGPPTPFVRFAFRQDGRNSSPGHEQGAQRVQRLGRQVVGGKGEEFLCRGVDSGLVRPEERNAILIHFPLGGPSGRGSDQMVKRRACTERGRSHQGRSSGEAGVAHDRIGILGRTAIWSGGIGRSSEEGSQNRDRPEGGVVAAPGVGEPPNERPLLHREKSRRCALPADAWVPDTVRDRLRASSSMSSSTIL